MSSTTIDSPRKIYAELTTRCNLQCAMCVKYTRGSCIPEEDMPLEVFARILPALENTESLILNGIGESLLHRNLTEIIRLASAKMAKGSTIGLQSNALLVTEQNAMEMVKAGLTTICFSVDRFDGPDICKAGEHSLSAVERAVKIFHRACRQAGVDFRIGLEIVLTRQTIGDLPGLVQWAAENGVEYILTSHLIPYDESAEKENLFNPHPREALELFEKYRQKGLQEGIDFNSELFLHRRSAGTRNATHFRQIMEQMQAEARKRDIQLNFDDLHSYDAAETRNLEKLLSKVEELAEQKKVEIFIPPLHASTGRECRFLKEKAVFVSAKGEVTPCHFLWHSYSYRLLSYDALVNQRSFGNVTETPLTSIWNSGPYRAFRGEAEIYDYSFCQTCPQGPCLTLLSGESNFASDCYGSQVPCGHCHWNLGGLRCL